MLKALDMVFNAPETRRDDQGARKGGSMKALSWILKAIAVFYVIGTMAYMMGGDPNNPAPAGAWVGTAVIAGILFFAASKVDSKIAKDAATRAEFLNREQKTRQG